MYIRLPIKFNLLKLILRSTDKLFKEQGQEYLSTLLKAMFSTAYFGLLRVGEITDSSHQIKAGNVHFAKKQRKNLNSARVFKNTYNPRQTPKSLSFKKQSTRELLPGEIAAAIL